MQACQKFKSKSTMYKSEEGYVVESKIQIHHVVSKNQGMVNIKKQTYHVRFQKKSMSRTKK